MKWIWRDIDNNMWIGSTSLNDIETLKSLRLKWKINNKPASISEKRAEWNAIRNTGLGLRVDESFFKDLTVLYINDGN